MPHLILLNGLPASGKSTFGRKLSQRLGIPLIAKDDFKELLGEQLGQLNVETSKLYGKVAYDLLIKTIETVLSSGGSCIVDSIFRQEDEEVFNEILKRHRATPIQIQFTCDGETLFQRFVRRFVSGERHPVHLEHYLGTDFIRERLLCGKNYELVFTPVFLQIDTTDIKNVDWQNCVEVVEERFKGVGSA